MKKVLLILLLLFSFTLTSCSIEPNYEESDLKYLLLSKSEEKQNYINTNEYKSFLSSLIDYSSDLSEKAYNKFGNNYDQMAISPLSIYMALAMATGIGSQDVQDELTEMFNIPYVDILEYTKYLYSSLNRERKDDNGKTTYCLQLSNSVWIGDKLNYLDTGLNTLKNSFYTDTYKAPFYSDNASANKAVKDYVYRNTKGLIDSEYEFDRETLFLLINTLYLKDVWNSVGTDLPFTSDTYRFKNFDSTEKSLKLLKGYYNQGKVQKQDGFDYFFTNTNHGLKIYFIKPTTKSLDEIYTKENLSLVIKDRTYDWRDENLKEEYYTRCFFPEIEAKFNEDLVQLLQDEYSVSSIFSESPNFSKLTNDNCWTTQLVHQTKLIIDKKGVEGAAVTIMANGATGAPDQEYKKIYYDFILDQAFGFIITQNDSVLFSGVVKNL